MLCGGLSFIVKHGQKITPPSQGQVHMCPRNLGKIKNVFLIIGKNRYNLKLLLLQKVKLKLFLRLQVKPEKISKIEAVFKFVFFLLRNLPWLWVYVLVLPRHMPTKTAAELPCRSSRKQVSKQVSLANKITLLPDCMFVRKMLQSDWLDCGTFPYRRSGPFIRLSIKVKTQDFWEDGRETIDRGREKLATFGKLSVNFRKLSVKT